MSLRDIPRSAVGGAVKLTRLPLDIVVAMLPGNGNATKPAAAIAVDRFEAALRDAAGIALFDEELREDAARRRIAADERERELRLRAEAEQRKKEAAALEERERALTAQAEAQRLQDAATKKKAARKKR